MKKITNGMLSQLLARGLDRLTPTATAGIKVGMTLELAPEEWGLCELSEPKLRGSVVVHSVNVKEGIITVDSVPKGTKRGDFLIYRS